MGARPLLVGLALVLGIEAFAADPVLSEDGLSEGWDAEATEPVEEGIWAWVQRFDGEVLPPDVVASIEAELSAGHAERSVVGDIAAVDVPMGFYTDPEKTLVGDPLHLDMIDPRDFDIPIEIDDSVVMWMEYFLGRGRKHFVRWHARGGRYRPMVAEKIAAAGLPQDLIYLSMIESGFNAYAYSHAHAAGLWQFIPGTARLYKLRVDWWVDERRDPELATDAALKMLGELHRTFGDWHLAMAAYNTGPGRIRRQLSATGLTTYWQLRKGDHLHKETAGYVPKIIAATILGHYPERYGFGDIEFEEPLVYDAVVVDRSIEVSHLAEAAGMNEEEFRLLNPLLRRFATPLGGIDIRVPVGEGTSFMRAMAELPDSESRELVRYVVRRGDTLSGIADKHEVSMSRIASANGLRNLHSIQVGQSLIIPIEGSAPPSAAASRTPASTPAPTRSPPTTTATRASAPSRSYTVRGGDSLSVIAGRHGVSVADLQRWNGISGTGIQVGQKLVLRGGSAPAGSSVTYVVRAGDTLSAIAERHGVALRDLQRWNSLANASTIQVGQRLKVQVASVQWTTHTVRSGDSLGLIASKTGCTVADIRAWNSLSSNTIHPGQRLKLLRR